MLIIVCKTLVEIDINWKMIFFNTTGVIIGRDLK